MSHPWNKGLKLSEMPQYSKMGFQKGNKLSGNSKSKANRFKKGDRPSPETEFKKGEPSWNKGKGNWWTHTDSWRKAIKEKNSGSNNYRWKPPELRKKSEKKHLDSNYRHWMFAVKNRDGWKCKIQDDNCSGRLEAHHILNWVDFPELRYEVNNGITLCKSHHPQSRKDEKVMSSYFQELINS